MLVHPPSTSNTQRQREFRERNPGYYGRLHRRKRAAIQAEMARIALAAQALAVAPKPLLMLPAPAEVFEIPGVNTLPAVLKIAELVPISRQTSSPST